MSLMSRSIGYAKSDDGEEAGEVEVDDGGREVRSNGEFGPEYQCHISYVCLLNGGTTRLLECVIGLVHDDEKCLALLGLFEAWEKAAGAYSAGFCE